MVLDAASYPLHQHMMVDGVETPFNVTFDHIAEQRWSRRIWVHLALGDSQRVMGASTGPEPIGGWIKIRLEYRFENKLQGHLHQSVAERGDTERMECRTRRMVPAGSQAILVNIPQPQPIMRSTCGVSRT